MRQARGMSGLHIQVTLQPWPVTPGQWLVPFPRWGHVNLMGVSGLWESTAAFQLLTHSIHLTAAVDMSVLLR